MINFDNCKKSNKLYNGSINKIGIVYNDERYLIKFASTDKHKNYSNSCFTEHIACKILQILGLKTQETLLGTYQDKIVVACKDFLQNSENFYDFASLKNSIINSSTSGYDTELSEILHTINNQDGIDISKEEIKEFFWDMFIADCLIGNFDRHNGNWGFIFNENTQKWSIAPIFDCGSSLFPQFECSNIEINKDEIEKRIYTFPNSAIKENSIKINPYNFLSNTKNKDCINALEKISKRIDLEKINEIIDSTPVITNKYKNFLKIIIKERKEKILDFTLEKHLLNDKSKKRFNSNGNLIVSKDTIFKLQNNKVDTKIDYE